MTSDVTPSYPLELSEDEAAYLDKQLEFLGRNAHGRAPSHTIRDKLHYRPPRFAVGTKVKRTVGYDGDAYFVVGHRFVLPGVWAALLAREPDADGYECATGETFLVRARARQEDVA